jgi:SAM-dependent methyltransferase
MRTWSPILRAVLALAAAYALLLAVARAGLLPLAMLGTPVVLLMGILAAALGRGLGLGPKWVPGLLFFPYLLDLLLRHPAPVWVWPVALAGLLLVYGGGILTRVPLYNSNRAAWEALLSLCPPGLLRFADLGAGLGGPLAFLAKARPDGFFLGVETSPLTCAIAWLRTFPLRGNCKIHWSSLWKLDLSGYEVVYAFLSPAPMEALWAKAEREMRPGTLFVSNTFAVPGREPLERIPLPGRTDACLLVFRMGASVPSVQSDGTAPSS